MSVFVESAAISHSHAQKLIDSAIRHGAERGVRVAVAVVDPALGLVAYVRSDGTTPHSVETSRRKANTSASTRKPTGWMQGDFAVALPLGTDNLLTNIRGGFPLVAEGRHLGGFGVAGGSPDQDAEIALAALAEVGLSADFS